MTDFGIFVTKSFPGFLKTNIILLGATNSIDKPFITSITMSHVIVAILAFSFTIRQKRSWKEKVPQK